ncbi:hypothetical protein GN244_ATG10506 [Phytophthora infestans]|uniref:Secreted RxLR effector peptide protein n=1 Tax=Phytophthora infestans TaxID=4787 RepID=A0A833SR02_PHYIN|nr:hypothetical protein GN244_ATG10506 [Phytophthora infestans]
MRFGLFLALLLAACGDLTLAERSTLEADSIHTNFRGENSQRNIAHRKLANEATFGVEDEERVLSRLKDFVQRNTQSIKLFQRNPAAIKEVENLKNSPVVAQSLNSFKGDPAMVQKLNTLKKHPEVLTSLQNAPAAQSINKLQTYFTGGKSRGVNSDGPSFIVCFLLIMGSLTATILLTNLFTQV